MMRRTLAVAVKELLQLRRDWRVVLTLVVLPMALVLIYGYALSFDVEHVRLVIVDRDGSRAAREVAQAFASSGHFDLAGTSRDVRELDRLFDSGRAQAALVVPAGYGAALAARRPTALQLVLDGADSQTATTVLAYARHIVASVTPAVRGENGGGPVVAAPLVWFNPDLASARFLVPGLVAFILMITAVIATALAVVREKERGTMESLRATPLGALELLAGKALPYLLIASAAAAGSLALAWALFDVPVRGSLGWLALVTVLYLVGGLGWGVLVSTLADSQQVAFQVSLLSSMLPTMLLSGFIFPISSMPAALQWISHIVPARYYLVALRAIVLKGAGPEMWWQQVVGLSVYAAVVGALATARTVRSL
ncbi:MAG TPA: ABC transporter permease [Thermoanaerobaculaceae bacterium]|nr:ABC transporter permease [Thermoanaerobaculaceae bacterium]HRS17444.1 ABC transporter permease [Thermoanaerobaculaceae bacterium]